MKAKGDHGCQVLSLKQCYSFSYFFNSWSLTHVSGPLFAVPRPLAPNFIVCDVARSPFPVSLWTVCGTDVWDWDGAVSGILQSICRPTDREEGVVGPTEMLPFSADGH